jgi:glutathione S-transferase
MQLYYSQTSPFARKVLMLAIEAGLADRIALQAVNVWEPASAIRKANPLGKIPALILDDGTALYDSPVIAEYLDSLHGGRRFFPQEGMLRWRALRWQALSDGMCDAAVLRRMEMLRPQTLRSQEWDARQRQAVVSALDVMEAQAADLASAEALDIGGLATMAALGYLDFRFADEPWRSGRPALTGWFEAAARRLSFIETLPAAS